MPSVQQAAVSSSDERLVLAVDLGTSGCKCALVALDGSVQAWAFRPVPLHLVGEYGVEQDAEDWWQAFLGAAQELLATDARLRSRVMAVCCSALHECTVPVDEHGNTLARAMLWLDMRGSDAIRRRARNKWLNIQGYGPLKLVRWLRLTGGAPSLSGKDQAGHIAWLRDHDRTLFDRTHKFLGPLDFMNLRLTGRFCATYDSALTTWATDNRDLSRIRYDEGLLRVLEVDSARLPELLPSTDVIGPLMPDVAALLGLSPSTRVVAGAVDNSAAAIGAGTVRDRELHLYLGTSSWIAAHVPEKHTNLGAFIASVPCARKDRYLAMAVQSAACSNLTMLRDRILFHADELTPDESRPDVYPLLDHIADRVPAGARGLIYLPWLQGERTPVDDRHLRAGLFNLSLEHTREDMIRAFLEGVALNTRWMLEPMLAFVGCDKGAPMTVVGGGGQSNVWCQIMADVTGMVIEQPVAPIQANALGAAFIAGIGLGKLSFNDVPDLCRRKWRFEPREAMRQLYDDRFGTFKELHRRLAPLYRRINHSQSTPR
ncbi:xylulokinase [Dyella nitratireducens]|uniref:Carbohydrate kinase n=1 Tax=Dyella nitratireducens TaxID=1849580 RepID=A0ABQ1GWP4_9GAMM|nr:FGGY-family carbohydrate kinase [Dyella nitratireducens]GGA50947.1 carbohydrate kinase [Dyella nitratireducens]GLQ42660.1 carbohydrate kinase [Dyella nitratireducens]